MRDGVKLFASVYAPKDDSQAWPIMFDRTPYSVSPYGVYNYNTSLGPSDLFPKEKFIFVYEDVRGKMMSEGKFIDMRPKRTKYAGLPTSMRAPIPTTRLSGWSKTFRTITAK